MMLGPRAQNSPGSPAGTSRPSKSTMRSSTPGSARPIVARLREGGRCLREAVAIVEGQAEPRFDLALQRGREGRATRVEEAKLRRLQLLATPLQVLEELRV